MTIEKLNRAIIQAEESSTAAEYINKIYYDLLTARDLCNGVLTASFYNNDFTGSLTEAEGTLEERKRKAEDWALSNYSLLQAALSSIEHSLEQSTRKFDTFMLYMDKE